ncbi:MAG: helix-turn-helix domain-containing protein [Mariniphaga sp.]
MKRKLGDDSGIPAHHLTYYFNSIRLMPFPDWRNSLRIEYAKTLINQGEAGQLTLQTIASKSGFSSQSTFIRSFKQWSGTTPSEYMKKIL